MTALLHFGKSDMGRPDLAAYTASPAGDSATAFAVPQDGLSPH